MSDIRTIFDSVLLIIFATGLLYDIFTDIYRNVFIFPTDRQSGWFDMVICLDELLKCSICWLIESSLLAVCVDVWVARWYGRECCIEIWKGLDMLALLMCMLF